MSQRAGPSGTFEPDGPAAEPSLAQAVNLQAWPGREHLRERSERPGRKTRLGDRSGVVYVAAAERGAYAQDGRPEERFGLGAFLVFSGRSLTGAGLVVPDDRPEVAKLLGPWCAARWVSTVAGPRATQLLTLSEFFDRSSGLFTRRVYSGAGWLVTADAGRTLGLSSEADVPARGGVSQGGSTLYLPTWSRVEVVDGREHRRPRAHRPPLQVKAVGAHGYLVGFAQAPGGPGSGKREQHRRAYRGRVFDVVSLGEVFDGVDSAELGDHLEAFGLARLDLPVAVGLDPCGAEALAADAEAVWHLALRLDDEAAGWLTTATDRSYGYGRLDLAGLHSAGGLAAELVRKAGVRSPLLKFPTPDDEALDRWIAAHRGGWLSAELAGAGLFPAADIDVHSAYPAVATLLGWWEVMTAARLRRRDVLAEVLALCRKAAGGDVSPLLRQETWRRLGLTLCEVIPEGETWPVEAPDADYPEGRAGMRPLRSPVALPFTWPDVVLAALRSGRVPRVLSATRLDPVGLQEGLRGRWPLYGGETLRLGEDPAVTLVRLRNRAKAAGDSRQAAMLRVLVNSLVYGNAARLDPVRRREGRRSVLGEQPFEFTYPPIAATVTAGTRLVVGVAEHLVQCAGGTVASRDTDGLLVVASPEGDEVTLLGGREVGAISWRGLGEALTRFDPLDPWRDGSPFWKTPLCEHEGRPLYGLVIGVKRYVLATLGEGGDLGEVVEATEHALGGSVVDPPGYAGRSGDGRHRWTREVASVAVRRAIAEERGETCLVPRWPWEADSPFPAIARCQAASPERPAELSGRLALKPFGRYLSAVPEYRRDSAPVALDPGGDLADWPEIDWRVPGGPVRVTLEPAGSARHSAVLLANLGGKAMRWLEPRPVDDRSGVVVQPELIRRVGRSGALIEAQLAEPSADTSALRALYSDGEPLAYLAIQARVLGPRRLARAAGISPRAAQRLRDGEAVRSSTIQKALAHLRAATANIPCCPVDGRPVFRRGATYCSPGCRGTASKRRQRQRKEAAR